MKHNIFFHQPKTGGFTTWSAILQGKRIDDLDTPECYVHGDTTWWKVHFGYPKQDLIQKCNKSGGTFFIGMRDPATHFVSYYNMTRMNHIDATDDERALSEYVTSLPLMWDWKFEQDRLKEIIELDLLESVFHFSIMKMRNSLSVLYMQDIQHIQLLNQETLDFDIQTKMGFTNYESLNITEKNAERYDNFEIANLDNLEEALKIKLYKFLEPDYYWYNFFQETYK